MFEKDERVLFTNTDDGEPVEVTVVSCEEDTSFRCSDPACCGLPEDKYVIRYDDGRTEETSNWWLESL